ncbi:T9SS type A sorting domain-containing protein [Muricauda sp. CAU 1633]|uniref:T9SS type A sorting domain-containing protein n=1 Tax=Allomuricauda sp. CAU 1633 TaxID=2816036 RepID=UPI001A8FCF13|nr:T9SS type A sorting domain-containing protein [Muricauda sp. CAU 1633]MBO0323535.1 T9SS type A sorting domain-containing protein [Muricauda sp. CAU 1633]
MKRALLLIIGFLLTGWSYGQYTSIPDSNFEQTLIDQGIDTEGGATDGRVLTADISNLSELSISGYDISDFDGLQAFSSLTIFSLIDNQAATIQEIDFSGNLLLQEIVIINTPNLPSVDIFQNNAITELSIVTRGNLFSSIDLSGKSGLTVLQLADNQISSIDVSGLPNLVDLSLAINPLTNLDVTSLSALETLATYESQIATLDLSQNTNLSILNADNGALTYVNLKNGNNNLLTSVELNGNSNLNCIQVDDVVFADQQTALGNWIKDITANYSIDCGYTLIPDANFEQALINQGIDSEGGPTDGRVLTSDVTGVTNLNISNAGINDLSGLEAFASLQILNVSDNDLNSLELQNLSLVEIYATNCNLGGKTIRFQNDPGNGGSFLTNVTTLELQYNGIGNGGSTINFGGIPNVTYLDVSNNNFGTIQLGATTSVEVLLANSCPNLATLANLDLLSQLVSLGVSFSNLSTLDVGQNLQLSFLNISGNTLTDLNLTNNNQLTSVYVGDNNLNSIALPNTNTTTELFLENNDLMELDISSMDQNLTDFNATGNSSLSCIQVTDIGNAASQVNWQKDANAEYRTDCSAPQPFVVTATISGATGTSPNFEITEGQSFELNFDTANTGTNGIIYDPVISITKDGIESTEDFTIDNLNKTFTISAQNPDGSIVFTVNEDGINEGDETYIINITSENTSNYTVTPTSFTVTIEDTDPMIVTPYLSLPVGNPADTVEEGQQFRIYFEADNSVLHDEGSFDVVFNSSGSTALFDEDYTHGNSPVSFIARYQQDAIEYLEIEVFVDDFDNEGEEIVIVLEKDPNDVYQWENANPDGSKEFIITIADEPQVISDPFSLEATISGVEIDNEGNLSINEGEFFSIGIKAQPPAAVTYEYEVRYDLTPSSATINDDYIPDSNPKTFYVQENVSEDGSLDFSIIRENNQAGSEPDETLVIVLYTNENDIYEWADSANAVLNEADGTLTYTITIKDVPPMVSDAITVTIDNTGGVEGGMDTFTISLFDAQGNPWTDHGNLEFPVLFNNEIVDPYLEEYFQNKTNFARVAEEGSYVLQGETQSPTESVIMVMENESVGELILIYPQEVIVDNHSEFYSVTLQQPVLGSMEFSLPDPLQANVRDDEGKIIIYLTIDESNLQQLDGPGQGCCAYYSIEEGESIRYSFNAEKGVGGSDIYEVALEFKNAENPYAINPEDNYPQASPDDYSAIGDLPIRGVPNDTEGSEYNFQVRTIINDDNGVDPSSEVSEKFAVSFNPIDSDKFVLVPTNIFDINNVNDDTIEYIDTDFYILESIQASLNSIENRKIAREFPLENASLQVELETLNNTGNDMLIYYSIKDAQAEGAATPGLDYTIDNLDLNTLEGFVTIPNNGQSAEIVINPLNDDIYELTETVTIELIDRRGYSLDNNFTQQITIESDDPFEYTATMFSGADNKSREADATDFAEMIIQLDKVPTEDIEVFFKVSGNTDTNQVIESDYEIFQQDQTTSIPLNDAKVLFEAGGTATKSIFIKALPDDVVENNESLFLTLDFGVNYMIGSPSLAEAELISLTSDVSTFDPSTINILVKSPRCPGTDQLGEIYLENDSPFPFEVTVVGKNDITYTDTKDLDKNDSEDNSQVFDELAIGSYEITLAFKPVADITYPDVLLPNYVVRVTEFDGMTAEENGFDGDMVSLKVSGSTRYSVLTDNSTHQFEFEDDSEHVIDVPLKKGINNLIISGDSDCKGIIEKRILFSDIHYYPNPTKDELTIDGGSFQGKLDIQLFDFAGRLVFRQMSNTQTDVVRLDVSSLEQGTYLGLIIPEGEEMIQFKLLKN